ncbi:MAG: ATP-dependent endonuclease [Hyphomonadaceae bacterium]
MFESNLLDGFLCVTRTFDPSVKESGGFFVDAMVNPAFAECRAEESKSLKQKKYEELRQRYGFAKVSRADEIDGVLEAWENENPHLLERRRVSGFRGFKNVAFGQLKRNTDFILVPAVKDAAADIDQARNSPVKILIDTIAKQTIQNNSNFKRFVTEANEALKEITSPEAVPELSNINNELTKILSRYYRDAKLSASWHPIEEMPVQFPSAEIAVSNYGFNTPIEGVGHGLQRAIILTVLQYLSENKNPSQSEDPFGEPQSDIIIAIEEPELYQHPTKQRLFRSVFQEITKSFNPATGIRIQIVYTTHSPLLVDFPSFSQLRMIRRDSGSDAAAVVVKSAKLEDCSAVLAASIGLTPDKAYTNSALLSRLHVFSSEIAEGFFGKCVVLTEGISDKSILEAYYKSLDRDPLAEGIVISRVDGKSKLERPAAVFAALGVPSYLVFDNDEKGHKGTREAQSKIRQNIQLQSLCGVENENCADWPVGVYTRYCAWAGNIESYLEQCVGGDLFEGTVQQVRSEYGLDRADCFKSPSVASTCLVRWREMKIDFPMLSDVVMAVDKLIE